eukprot:COSAG02_NODE_37720_length_438_cov_0.914454_2_plen_60_part_01
MYVANCRSSLDATHEAVELTESACLTKMMHTFEQSLLPFLQLPADDALGRKRSGNVPVVE